MGKAKKDRKAGKGDDSGSEVELETKETAEKFLKKNIKSDNKSKAADADEPKSKEKKGGNKKKEKSKVASDSEDDEVDVAPQIQKKFALLEVDSGPESLPSDNNDSDSEPQIPIKKETKKKVNDSDERTKEQGAKKGKKSRRKKNDSDEDLDKVLAELELEYSGGKVENAAEEETNKEVPIKEKSKVTKQKSLEEEDNEDDAGGTVKTAAQKKKEKKEREKLKKQAAKAATQTKEPKSKKVEDTIEATSTASKPAETKLPEAKQPATKPEAKQPATKQTEAKQEEEKAENENEAETEGKNKKKKKGAAEKEVKEPKKGPGKKTIAAMQETLRKIKEEEERLRQEEEERIRQEEEAENLRLEALRVEQERKEKRRKLEKERKERLRAEGKLLTSKQKADRARAQAFIESRKAQGLDLPDVGERKIRPGTRIRPNKFKQQNSTEKPEEPTNVEQVDKPVESVPTEKVEEVKSTEGEIKDTWDADSSDNEESEEVSIPSETQLPAPKVEKVKEVEKEKPQEKKPESEEATSDESEDDEDDDEESESDDSEESCKEEVDHKTDAEKRTEKAKSRIEQRRRDAEAARTVENLRASVVCVLGHVDTGKTKILDKLRRTNVQDGEAGGITQQIGATNVPIENIKDNIKHVKGANDLPLRIPGLLIIDTPGHESFSNLRSRGSSLCDMAILVVDIMHGLEPQTIESLNLLKTRKTPFIVALNKIDRLYDWQTMNRKDVSDIVKLQSSSTQTEFERRTKQVILEFAEQGMNAALFYENPDFRTYVSLVPTSAVTGEGMGNLLALIVESSQNLLAKRLMYSDELQATVLEVKAIPGLGTTIDVILVNGTLREGESMILAGTDGPIVTQIRSLLMPQPMRELRVKNAYIEYKEVKAAQGVKIAAKDLEKAIAGLNLFIAQKPDEIDVLRNEVAKELKSALSNIKLQERGVYVQASTLGSLEALLEFLRSSKIPYSGIRIGPVVKRDVMKASIMLEHESQYATILAFDVKIERDAQELADYVGVKIFQADIIYHLFDKFMSYRDELKRKKREEFKNIAVFPCKLKVLPQFIFNSRDPIVMGIMVEAGIVREGTPICVPSKEFVDIGIVTSIENNHKTVESARKGMEVCIKIDPIPGEAPKMFGRHFDETDMLVSKISRQSIDACKDYFRDDLLKTDWQLMVELKKTFQIM